MMTAALLMPMPAICFICGFHFFHFLFQTLAEAIRMKPGLGVARVRKAIDGTRWDKARNQSAFCTWSSAEQMLFNRKKQFYREKERAGAPQRRERLWLSKEPQTSPEAPMSKVGAVLRQSV